MSSLKKKKNPNRRCVKWLEAGKDVEICSLKVPSSSLALLNLDFALLLLICDYFYIFKYELRIHLVKEKMCEP